MSRNKNKCEYSYGGIKKEKEEQKERFGIGKSKWGWLLREGRREDSSHRIEGGLRKEGGRQGPTQ